MVYRAELDKPLTYKMPTLRASGGRSPPDPGVRSSVIEQSGIRTDVSVGIPYIRQNFYDRCLYTSQFLDR